MDESLAALDESIKNLDDYESDECSTVKSTTSHISTAQRHCPTDEELRICDSVTSTKECSYNIPRVKSKQFREQFLSKVSDRLFAVKQDRDNMQKAVQEQASRRGQKIEDIQV